MLNKSLRKLMLCALNKLMLYIKIVFEHEAWCVLQVQCLVENKYAY